MNSLIKDNPLSDDLWNLYPMILDLENRSLNNFHLHGGLDMENVNQICIIIKNYTSRDPEGMLRPAFGKP